MAKFGAPSTQQCSSNETPKVRGAFLGVPIRRTIVFWGPILGSPYFGRVLNVKSKELAQNRRSRVITHELTP